MVWFITVLLNVSLMGIEPPTGWLQDDNGFDNKVACEAIMEELTPMIHLQYMQRTFGLGAVEAIECMTEEDWINRNEALGHEVPENIGSKRTKREPTT